MIWDGQVAAKQERKLIDVFRFFEDPCEELGEIHGFRFNDGHGGGCQVSGSFMGLKLNETSEGLEAELDMAPNSDRQWRVW